jgi:hypothetical protein
VPQILKSGDFFAFIKDLCMPFTHRKPGRTLFFNGHVSIEAAAGKIYPSINLSSIINELKNCFQKVLFRKI